MKLIGIRPAKSHHDPSNNHSCCEPQQENDDPNSYQQRLKAPCFSSMDTLHLSWVEV